MTEFWWILPAVIWASIALADRLYFSRKLQERAANSVENKVREELQALRSKLEASELRESIANNRIRALESQVDSLMAIIIRLSKPEMTPPELIKTKPEPYLIVFIGEQPGLALDLASLRAVRTETGMKFNRVLETTPQKIKAEIDNSRLLGRRIFVHMACEASPEGIMIGGELLDAVWLSEQLDGVEVLVLMGCETSYVGAFLGVVPYVITAREKILHTDASFFTRAFWTEVGRGTLPTLAFDRALRRAPAGVGEFVEIHSVRS